MTTETGGDLPHGVTVHLDALRGMRSMTQYPDSSGRFEFTGLPGGHYRLSASAEGFRSFEQDIYLTAVSSGMSMQVILRELRRSKPDPEDLPSLTDMAAPKKARKEHKKGVRALEEESLPKAQAHFQKAVAVYPCFARAQRDLALVFLQQREAARGEAALRKAIDCDPGYLEPYSVLARLLTRQKKYADSEEILLAALRHAPSAWDFHYQLGGAYSGQAKYREAEAAYRKAQEFNPDAPPAIHVRLADVYVMERDFVQAYAEMQAYLQAEPNGYFAANVKKVMAQIELTGAVSPRPAKDAQTSKP